MFSILNSKKEFGGAEIYVRKLKKKYNINFLSIKGDGLRAVLKKILSNERLILHDLRAALLKFFRPLKNDVVLIHGPGKNFIATKFIINLLQFTNCEIILVSGELYDRFHNKKNLLQLNNYSSFEEVKLEHKKSDFVYFGRIEKSKGCDALVNFWNENNLPQTLHLIGGGTILEKLKAIKNPNIIFHGPLSQEEIKLIIKHNCSHYISLSFKEGLSLSLLEALSCGLIPIVANIPSQRFVKSKYGFELIEENLNNLLSIINHPYNNSELKGISNKIKSVFLNLNDSDKLNNYWEKQIKQ